jgi:hypothetical protein
MNIPGFTAEDSLYKTSGHRTYRVPNRFGTHQASTVIPQMPRSGGRTLCYASIGCFCNSDAACNAMFSEPGLCGNTAYCDERGCFCGF